MTTATPILDMAETITRRLLANGQKTALARSAWQQHLATAALGTLASTMLTERGLEVPAQTHDETSVRRMLATLLEVTDG